MTDWYQQAACRGATDLFFPDRGESSKQAKLICADCPVRAECLEAGMGEVYGVWGGMNQRERERLGRRRQYRPVAECGTDSGYFRHRRLGEPTCDACKAAHVTAVMSWSATRRAV